MNKIPTIFQRDWEGNRGVIDKYVDNDDFFVNMFEYRGIVATEKLDGTNIRVTVRNHMVVRVEKRRNPDKIQKAKGIEDPWYMDASEYESGDKWIMDAVKNTDFSGIIDGEWSGEAVGKDIQGNPLKLVSNTVIFFSLPLVRDSLEHKNTPTTYKELKVWLPEQKSVLNPEVPIEGIVWHWPDGRMAKIKTKDFK